MNSSLLKFNIIMLFETFEGKKLMNDIVFLGSAVRRSRSPCLSRRKPTGYSAGKR